MSLADAAHAYRSAFAELTGAASPAAVRALRAAEAALRDAVFARARARLHGRSGALGLDADDLTQDALRKALPLLPASATDEAAAALLEKTLTNLLIDAAQRRTRAPEGVPPDDAPDPAPDALRTALARAELDAVGEALDAAHARIAGSPRFRDADAKRWAFEQCALLQRTAAEARAVARAERPHLPYAAPDATDNLIDVHVHRYREKLAAVCGGLDAPHRAIVARLTLRDPAAPPLVEAPTDDHR